MNSQSLNALQDAASHSNAGCGPLLSVGQTAQLSGVSEADLLGLVEYGVLKPCSPEHEPLSFEIGSVMALQRAALMREDLALDYHGFALTMMFLSQITALEAQLHHLQRDRHDGRSLESMEPQQG